MKIRNGAFEIENSQKETLDPSRSQIATAPNKRNIRYLPYVFTEQGIAMLSGLLKSDIAIEVSIKIMNAFVEMRKFIINNAVIFEKIHSHELKILEHDDKFERVFNELQKEENIKQKIFYNGQIYDAYKGLIKIIKQAKNELVIIDNYLDDSILEVILNKNSDVSVIIITNQKTCKLLTQDIEKFNKQYSKITIKYSEDFHDRFIIIDKKIIYHCGASLKDLGNKTFAINEMYDKSLLKKILEL